MSSDLGLVILEQTLDGWVMEQFEELKYTDFNEAFSDSSHKNAVQPAVEIRIR